MPPRSLLARTTYRRTSTAWRRLRTQKKSPYLSLKSSDPLPLFFISVMVGSAASLSRYCPIVFSCKVKNARDYKYMNKKKLPERNLKCLDQMDPCMLNINTQLFVCVHEQTSGRRFLCFRAVSYYRVGRWFFMAADILHRSFRTRFICVYGARQILEDLFYCFVHLVSNLQIRQGFFRCCCRFLLRFSCKTKCKSWQKSKYG